MTINDKIRKTIVIIRDKESIIVRSLEKKFTELEYEVITSTLDFKEIRLYQFEALLFVLYLPSEITENMTAAIKRLCEMVEENSRFLIAIGEKKLYDNIVLEVPAIRNHIWLDRPLDMNMLTQSLDEVQDSLFMKSVKKRILIVDDDPGYARMVKEWLKDRYKVDIVTSGVKALTYLGSNDVDLILLDYEMPVVDGAEVLKMLREEPETSGIPVIFLTGVGTMESVARVMEYRPKGYMLKSTTRKELIAHLDAFFAKRA